MKATEFFLGFGPALWSFRRGETEYGVKAIPAGGYVRIIGMSNLEEVDPEDEPRTYRQATTGKRLWTVSRGRHGEPPDRVHPLLRRHRRARRCRRPEHHRSTIVAGQSRRPRPVCETGDTIRRDQRHAVEDWDDLADSARRPARASRPRSPSSATAQRATIDGHARPAQPHATDRVPRREPGHRRSRRYSARSPQSASPSVVMWDDGAGHRSRGWPSSSRRRASKQYSENFTDAPEAGSTADRGAPALDRRHRRPSAATSSAATSGRCCACSARSTSSSRCST